MFTTDLLRFVGLPAFALFTLALHLWSCVVALAFGGWITTAMTLCAPVASWLWWVGYIWRETGTLLTAYGLAVALWFVCLGLVWLALRVRD